MADVGRPRALDEARMREICALLTAGYGIPAAAEYVGCAASTIRREAARNQEFGEKLRRALLASELDPLNSIRQSARSNWRAAAWYLERLNPQRYARRNAMMMTMEEVKEFVEALAEIVFTEVRHPAVQKKIVRRLMELSGEVGIDPSSSDMKDLQPPPAYEPNKKPRKNESSKKRSEKPNS